MEPVVNLETINENFNYFLSPPSPALYSRSRSWRQLVIANRENIFIFLKILLNSPLPAECQIYIIQIVREMIDTHLNSLQLIDITFSITNSSLKNVTNPAVITKIGEIIGYAARLVYQNEKKFLFPLPNPNEINIEQISPLQWESFNYIIEYISKPRTDCTEKVNKEIKDDFKNNFLFPYYALSLNALNIRPKEGVRLLLQCLSFVNSQQVKMISISMLAPPDNVVIEMLNVLQNQAVFDQFLGMVTNFQSPISSDVLNILQEILNFLTIKIFNNFRVLVGYILKLCSKVLSIPNFFFDGNNISSFGNLLLFIAASKNIHLLTSCEEFNYDLMAFVKENLSNNYLLSIRLLPQACPFFDRTQSCVSRSSPVWTLCSDFLFVFIESTMSSLESNPEPVYDSLLLGPSERKDLRSILTSLFRLTINRKNEFLDLLTELIGTTTAAWNQELSIAQNAQIGFLLFVARVAMKNSYCEMSSIVLKKAFETFVLTNDKIEEIGRSLGDSIPFPMEYFSLAFMKTFLKTKNFPDNVVLLLMEPQSAQQMQMNQMNQLSQMNHMGHMGQIPFQQSFETQSSLNDQSSFFVSQSFNDSQRPLSSMSSSQHVQQQQQQDLDSSQSFLMTIQNEKTNTDFKALFDSPQSVTVFIFQRFWNDMIHNICPEKAKKCLKEFIDNSQNTQGDLSNTISVIVNSSYPNIFLNNYLNFPCKSIIYYTIVNIMISSDEVSPLFFESFEASFVGKDDERSLQQLFKILSSWFISTKKPDRWHTLYLYFFSRFMNTCIHASTDKDTFIYLLKFLHKMMCNMPVSTPFSTFEPHSYRMIKSIMMLLKNITETAGSLLKPIEIDESIYDKAFITELFDSKPISLSEAHCIGLHERQLKIKKRNSSQTSKLADSNDEKWNLIPQIIETANCLIKSSIPNFGIMEIYEDQCIFVFFDQLINVLIRTPVMSILSHEVLISDLSEFILALAKNFRNVIVGSRKFWEFTVSFLRATFLSKMRDVLKTTCLTLTILIKGFTTPQEIEILRNHFILAFNVALYCVDCSTAAEFTLEFVRLDPSFVAQIGHMIEADLSNEVKPIFHQSFAGIWNELEDLENPSQENIRKKLIRNFTNCLDAIGQYSIKLYALPSLAQYFNFRT